MTFKMYITLKQLMDNSIRKSGREINLRHFLISYVTVGLKSLLQ